METLSSLKNPRVQLWRSLKDRKARKETGLFLVEGRKMVTEALASAFPVETILCDEAQAGQYAALLERSEAVLLPAHVLAAVCDTKTPQGIAAVVRMSDVSRPGKRLVALDGVQDPGNVGTILRTADCAGMEGLLLSEQCADVFSPKVLRATMGSIFRMPVEITGDLPGRLRGLRKDGYSVLSSQLDGTPFYCREGVGDRYVLVIGNESSGVSPQVQQEATHRLRLPMRGGAESLNAAVAAGIMMYELTRELAE